MKNTYIFWSVLQRFFVQKQGKEHSKNPKSMTFENTGPSGYAIYWNENKSIRFYTEVGGGDCIFYMVTPSAEQWQTETGYSLEERDEILKYVAEESLKKQVKTHQAFYKIQDKHIVFYQK